MKVYVLSKWYLGDDTDDLRVFARREDAEREEAQIDAMILNCKAKLDTYGQGCDVKEYDVIE